MIFYDEFGNTKDIVFKDQILKASPSVINNIAEGFERRTDNELRHFLFVAKGSCGEVRSMLILAKELEKISESKYDLLVNKCLEV